MCLCVPNVDHLFCTLPPSSSSFPFCTHSHRKLVARIDTDGDSLIDRSEMIAWLKRVEDSYYQREVKEELQRADKDEDGHITFQEYMRTFGFPGKRERDRG